MELPKEPSKSSASRAISQHQAVQLLASLIQAGEPALMVEQAVGGLMEVLDCEAAALVLERDGYFDLVAQTRANEQAAWHVYASLPPGSPEATCLKTDSPVLIKEPLPETSPLRISLNMIAFSSMICAPIRMPEKTLGFLAAINKVQGIFSDADAALIENIAVSFAGLMQHFSQTQRLKIINAELEAGHWQLQNSRNILDVLFNSIPISVYIIDRNFELVSVNIDRAKRAGQSQGSLIGKRCYNSLYQNNEICPGCKVIETIFGGKTTSRIYRIWNNTGEAQEWDINTFPISGENGEIQQAILFEQDVTEKRRLEATLVQSEKLSAVGQLAAGVAHEISNPLSAIIANAQLLQHELPTDDDKQELADLILRAGERAAQVVRNLLDLIRKERVEFILTDVNETLEDAISLVQHEFNSRNIALTRKLAKDLPPIQGSGHNLQGIWLNIIMNALDAMENGKGEVIIQSFRLGNDINVVITDTGKGMAPEQLNKIFEPFYTTKAPGRGTGLGLSVVQRVIKQHGGHIQVKSQPNVGTEFVITLPISS